MEVKLEDLNLQEKIGQMLMVGMETTYVTERVEKLIKQYKIGGIILYRKNFKTYEDLIKLVNDLKELNKENKVPLFIAIDQEGGRVNRMPKELKNLPSANAIASLKDIEIVKESAGIIGEVLSKTGFNIDFAPVLDIKRFPNNHAIGDRAFGENKEDVIKYGIEFMKELQQNNIIPVVKHFPGHGATKKDSHFILPVINKDITELEQDDMLVFENAIQNGADAILIGHLIIKGITGMYPASLSKRFIGKYLRKKYRYNGLVITDDLKMRAIKYIYGQNFAFKKAFEAGNDIIIFRYNKKEEEKAIQTTMDLVNENKISIGRINRSVKRILKVKSKYNVNDTKIESNLNIEEINSKIEEIRKHCIIQ